MSYNHLTLEERKKIARMLEEKISMREIARRLGRNVSTISRENKRNRTFEKRADGYIRYHYRGKYMDTSLTEYVQEKLMQTWSPEQIAGRIRLDHPQEEQMRISHTSIYRWIRKGQMSQATAIHLRHSGRRHGEKRGKGRFVGIQLLNKRCKEAYHRKRYGDWEIDTILSSASSAASEGLLSMCDRKTRYCVLILLRKVLSRNHVFKALAAVSEYASLSIFYRRSRH